jgi:glycosyltransferase involved in cell wall biosynthesis
MVQNKKVVVVLPAYNAERTLEATYREIPLDFVDQVILVDDGSTDQTLSLAKALGIVAIGHDLNRGYGANQKTCYRAALEHGADIVVMLHPDYQYTPKLIPAMALVIASGQFDVALGSRILGGQALKGGMPIYKYVSNRVLTLVQNLLMGAKLSEYHTGYRAFTRAVLEKVPLDRNSDDFVFDAQMLSQILYAGFRVAEITCPAKYFPEASSIGLLRSVRYGLGCLATAVQFRLSRWGIWRFRVFAMSDRADSRGRDSGA